MLERLKRGIFTTLRLASTAYARRKVAKHGKGLTVNFPSLFSSATEIGNHCHFNGIRVRGIGKLVIGDYFHSGDEILVITQNHNYRNPRVLPYDEGLIARDVRIGNYVWVGSRVILLPGAELGDGCIVQAGAVVSGRFPANAIIGGNPATVLRYRDTDVVQRLVAQGSYLL